MAIFAFTKATGKRSCATIMCTPSFVLAQESMDRDISRALSSRFYFHPVPISVQYHQIVWRDAEFRRPPWIIGEFGLNWFGTFS